MLAIELVGTLVVGVLTLVGTAVLTGTLGPFVVLAFALGGAFALRAYAERALAGIELAGDDLTLHRLMTALLALTVAFAFLAAVVLTAVG